MSILGNIILVALGVVLTLASLWYGQHSNLLPVAASTEAELFDGLFNTTMVIATGIFLVVQGLIIFCAIRFRKRAGDESDGDPTDGNIPLEVVWTAIPALIVLWLAIDSFDVYQRMQTGSGILTIGHAHHHHSQLVQDHPDPSVQAGDPHYQAVVAMETTPTLHVDVMGMQYAWVFTYPETGVVSSELHVPVGQRVKLSMTAQDVNHAFWVPQFRLKQDLIAGSTTDLSFTANKTGEYPIVCAELCGPYHGIMQSQLFVEEPPTFLAWQQEQLVAVKPTSPAANTTVADASAFAQQHQPRLNTEAIHVLHTHP